MPVVGSPEGSEYEGVDYTIVGGSHDGEVDRFVFGDREGNDTIWGFEGGEGGDIIDLSLIADINSLDDIYVGQDGDDTVIGLYADEAAQEWHSIRLMDFVRTDLSAEHNFLFG